MVLFRVFVSKIKINFSKGKRFFQNSSKKRINYYIFPQYVTSLLYFESSWDGFEMLLQLGTIVDVQQSFIFSKSTIGVDLAIKVWDLKLCSLLKSKVQNLLSVINFFEVSPYIALLWFNWDPASSWWNWALCMGEY